MEAKTDCKPNEAAVTEQEAARRDEIYQRAVVTMRGVKNAQMQQEAIELFLTIRGWRDADEKIAVCEQRIRELREKEEAERLAAKRKGKKRRKAAVIALAVAAACGLCVLLLFTALLPTIRYGQANALYRAGQYEEAIAAFTAMDGYRDSETMILRCQYGAAEVLMRAGAYEEAALAFEALSGFSDSAALAEACKAIHQEQQYAAATALLESGAYKEAYQLLIALDGYKDSEKLADAIFEDYKAAALRNAKRGDTVLFGAYEQDNDASNGKEDIEWLVLAREEDRILVISRYVLDCRQYSSSEERVSWDTCSLRRWLNGEFLDAAFREEEQNRIRDVIGKVFLLSQPDAYKYMDTDEARRCAPTAYAIAQGVITSSRYPADGKDTCGWWLRTPYSSNFNAAVITIDGAVSTLDVDLWLAYYGVRPALWINTDGM